MSPTDRRVLLALQLLLVVVPLLLGGRHAWTVPLTLPVVLVLLALTVRERERRTMITPAAGVGAIVAFAALALATTLPLPPRVLAFLAPSTARLYAAMLPGWPDGGAWTTWRALAIDPYAVWVELGRLAIGFAVFAIVVAYPWRAAAADEAPTERVLARLLVTLIAMASGCAALALVKQVAGSTGSFLIADGDLRAPDGRASGPFVNPNHFAAWLEMLIPVAATYAFALAHRLNRRLARGASTGRGMGVRPWRAWVSALIVNQRRLWLPLLSMTAVLLMILGHLATGSRGGTAALLVGLAVAGAGALATIRRSARRTPLPRIVPLTLAAALALASSVAIARWATLDADANTPAVADISEVSLASRIAVGIQGLDLVRDHWLLGTGLGSWLDAFRPYQAPPVEGGIWDHAHDDYLELAAETGLAGLAVALAFALAVLRVVRPRRPIASDALVPRHGAGARDDSTVHRPIGFEVPEWQAALRDRTLLRWGLAGGIAAILVHSLVEFALRMPANLLTLMTIVALLVLSARPEPAPNEEAAVMLDREAADADPVLHWPARLATAPAMLLVLLAIPLLPRGANTVASLAGAAPLAPADCLASADRILAEGGDARAAVTMVRRALDRAPADLDAYAALATALGPGADGDEALHRALMLAPWSAAVRDALALRLWDRGEHADALAELEESMVRFPYLVTHAYLSPDSQIATRDVGQLIQALAEGDSLLVRLVALDGERSAAIERGLRRALATAAPGTDRSGIVQDLVTLLEVRGHAGDAAEVLRAEADRSSDGRAELARAARNYLKAQNDTAAEHALLDALVRAPDQGDLYRTLAVDVYAERGDFQRASTVLRAGARNASDMIPVYRGITQLLTRRESAHIDERTAPLPAILDGDIEEEAP